MLRKILIVTGICSGILLLFLGTLAYLGSNIDQKHRSVVSETLPHSQQLIWSLISDVKKIPDWNESIAKVEIIEPNPLSWREFYKGGQSMSYAIIEADPPRFMKRKVIDQQSPFKGHWSYELQEIDGQTQLTIIEEGQIENSLIRFFAHKVMGIDSFQTQYLKELRQGAAKFDSNQP